MYYNSIYSQVEITKKLKLEILYIKKMFLRPKLNTRVKKENTSKLY